MSLKYLSLFGLVCLFALIVATTEKPHAIEKPRIDKIVDPTIANLETIGKEEKTIDSNGDPVLSITCRRDRCIELLAIEYLEDGREWRKNYRRKGKSYSRYTNYKNGDAGGYNFKFKEHSYSDYSIELLTDLSNQGDQDAILMLIKNLTKMTKTDYKSEKAFKWSIKAYKAGNTSAMGLIAWRTVKADKVKAAALYMIERDQAPAGYREAWDGNYFDYLSPHQKLSAENLSIELRQKYQL